MEKRCYGCMKIKSNGLVCEHCGYDERRENGNHQLPVGTVIGGQYVLGRVLGQGGFGITYIAWDRVMQLPVAIKEYFPSGFAGRDSKNPFWVTSYDNRDSHAFEGNKKRFLREAESLAKLWNVPQIVKVLRYFEENGTAYIAMEYVEGINLRDKLKQLGRPMTMAETLMILGPVMEALGHVHEVDLVHRDISPDNIMVLPDGSAKLLDFGAARYVENPDAEHERNTSTQAILKHGFAPPEQYQRRGALGPWTDIYAMCATIYYCLTGTVPVESMSRIMEGAQIGWGTIPDLRAEQRAALEKGLSLLPKDRFATVRELWQALQPKEKKEKPKKKGWIPAAAVLLAAVVGIAAVFAGGKEKTDDTYLIQEQSQTTPEEPTGTVPQETPVEETAAETTVVVPSGQVKRVALITDGGMIDDASFNQACWQGVVDWSEANGVDYVYYQPFEGTTDSYILSVSQAIAEGADTVVLPGWMFGAVLTEIMDLFPDVHFIAIDVADGDLTTDYINYYDPAPNTACITFAEEEAGYLAGYAAVMEGYTKLGVLAAMPVPAIVRYGHGFIQGADDAAEERKIPIEIKYWYSNQYFGDRKVTEEIKNWYAGGTEVVFGCGGSVYTSAVEVARVYGGKVIGLDTNHAHVDSCILTSGVKQMENATEEILDALNSGNWALYGGKISNLTLADGDYIGLPADGDSWRMKNFTVVDYQALKAKLARGTVVVDCDGNYAVDPMVSEYTTVSYFK